MWIRRASNFNQLLKVVQVPSTYLKVFNSPTPVLVCRNCLNLSRSIFYREKSNYVYDPKTDAFVPQGQQNTQSSYNPQRGGSGHGNNGKNNSRTGSFLKRWARNLFLLTGGIVWCGLIYTALFVDIKETSELFSSLQDSEEGLRLFVFYDIANISTKTELADIISNEDLENATEIVANAEKKEIALKDALDRLKNHEVITESLGAPIHFVGFHAAKKLDRFAKNFQNLTQTGEFTYVPSDVQHKKMDESWTAECLLEGPNGLVNVTLTFEKPFEQEKWILLKVEVDPLEKSGNSLLRLENTLPEGVRFNN